MARRVTLRELEHFVALAEHGSVTGAAAAMGLTAGRLHELGIVDQVIKEPLGGAHRDYEQAADAIRKALVKQLDELKTLEVEALVERRYDRLMSYGNVVSATADE